tara:strand:+ start:726 stop:1034 length:309 start_codon:yes stop_codon:yes gene_type:complete
MANYFKVVNGMVTESIIADAEFMSTFRDTSAGTWIEESDSINGKGSIGKQYNPQLNAWYEPQPFSSWTLNTTTFNWEAPVTYPTDGKIYQWDETTKSWKEII